MTNPTMTYAEAVPHAVRWALGLEKIDALAGRTYDQNAWGECGTACNVSGAACVLAGLFESPPPADYEASHPLAASLMYVSDPRVLPVLAAVVEGWDVEAACAAARATGLLIHVSGEQTVTNGLGHAFDRATQNVTGGEGYAYGTATQTVTGGEGYAYDRATQNVKGGEGYAYETATQTVTGGVGRAYGNATQNVTGGEGVAFGTATQTVTGGKGYAYGSATQNVTGGEGVAYDRSTVRVCGGTCRVRSDEVTVAEHTGGTIVWERPENGAWTETRREVKP